MSNLRVLISGASVAGPALAYWLVRAGCKVTIIERASSLRIAGQGIDIRDSARDVIKRMEIFERILDRSSHEEGLSFVDKNNRCIARFGVDLSGKGDSPTCDIEILRGELARILFNVTKDDVTYKFGETVLSLEEREKEVEVKFANGTPPAAFDLVVAADGIGSQTRNLAFGNNSSQIRSLNSYVSYFSVPIGSTDTRWSRVHWVKGGRNVSVRPDNVGRTRAFLSLTAYSPSDPRLQLFAQASKESIAVQKQVVQDHFHDGDWETARILEGMHASDDFYMQHIAQVRLPRWSSGRVTVVGDAGYAPSPFTGMGTSLAFIGAYVLAGEISRQPGNVPAALESYERVLRPYVEDIQHLPPGIPWLVNPQSALGVRVLENAVWGIGVMSGSGLSSLVSKVAAWLPISRKVKFELPDYEAFRESRGLVG